jgi:hypothetical protein
MRMTVPIDAATARALGIGVVRRGKEARSLLQKSKLFFKRGFSSLAGRLTFDAAMSAYANATVATNNELAMLGLRAIDLRPLPVGKTREPDLLPSVPLPYLGGLSTVEVLEVREKARRALPAFRARLQRDLMSASSDRDNEERAVQLAAELRLEVAELEAELASLRLPVARRREGLLSVLSFLLTLVGLGTGNTEAVIAGGATLAGTLASVHQTLSDRERRHAVVKSQPASVLLTAKHMHQQSTHLGGADQR